MCAMLTLKLFLNGIDMIIGYDTHAAPHRAVTPPVIMSYPLQDRLSCSALSEILRKEHRDAFKKFWYHVSSVPTKGRSELS